MLSFVLHLGHLHPLARFRFHPLCLSFSAAHHHCRHTMVNSTLSSRRTKAAPAPILVPPPPRPRRSKSTPNTRSVSTRPKARSNGVQPPPATPTNGTKSTVTTPVVQRRRNAFDHPRQPVLPSSVLLAPPCEAALPTPPMPAVTNPPLPASLTVRAAVSETLDIVQAGWSVPPPPQRTWTSPCHRPHAAHTLVRGVPAAALPAMPAAIEAS